MKKSLLALAVLTAVTGAASAQSSVTLYGKVDLGLVLDSGNADGKSVRISSGVTGGSRIGFKGVEDLGGGMKAAFQLETGYCADSAAGAPNFCTGSNNFMGRQAHGDLTGAFGALSAGRQYSLGFNNLSTIDPFGTGFAGQVNNIVDPSGIRLNNSATYSTPNMGGFTASAEIAFGEQTGNWEANRETGAGLTYASGPAYVGFTFYDVGNAHRQRRRAQELPVRRHVRLRRGQAPRPGPEVHRPGLARRPRPDGRRDHAGRWRQPDGFVHPPQRPHRAPTRTPTSSASATCTRCRSARRSTPRSRASRTSTAPPSPSATRRKPARGNKAFNLGVVHNF